MRWFSHRTCLGWRTAYPGNRRLMTWSTLRSSCTIWTSVHQAARYAVACRPNLFCGVTTSPAWCPSSRNARTSSRAITRCPPSANGGLDVTTAMVATSEAPPLTTEHNRNGSASLGQYFLAPLPAGRDVLKVGTFALTTWIVDLQDVYLCSTYFGIRRTITPRKRLSAAPFSNIGTKPVADEMRSV